MNTLYAMIFKIVFAFVFSIHMCTYVLAKDQEGETWKGYFRRAVGSEVVIQTSTNTIVRDGGAINAQKTITSKGYRLKSSSEVKIPRLKNMAEKTFEYAPEAGDQSQRFLVSMVESENGRDETLNSLAYLMDSSSNMLGVRFQQYNEGPGDICFVNKGAKPKTDDRGISMLFFCRDNVAVKIVPFAPKSDILRFARLIDSSIMMTSGKNQRIGNNEAISPQSTNEIVTNNSVAPQLSTNSLTK